MGSVPIRQTVPCLVSLLVWAIVSSVAATEPLPQGATSPPAIEAPHFPSRLHTFVWRNWESVEMRRLAEVVGATPEQIGEVAASMGLPPQSPISPLQADRGYISVIRRNWHLLPYEQLLTLLGWDAKRLAYTLKEDDFLWIKLGQLKPACSVLQYEPPTAAVMARCTEIRQLVKSQFGDELARPMESRFAFVQELSRPTDSPPSPPARSADEPIRFLYSYCAVFGDPLLDPKLDPFPDGLLERLAEVGVNGVWLHTVLRQLALSSDFPEFGEGHKTRLATLRQLVARAKRYGIDVYLYMNEPRSMPASFFANRPEMAGAKEAHGTSMCTSVPAVRRFLTEATELVFREVPGLGGVFTISASENQTNCWSHGGQAGCPRCSKRTAAEVIAEVNRAIAEGVRRGSPEAKVIVWDWGWPDASAEQIIQGLPDDVYFMSVSEWSLPINRGGVATTVGEYSLSAVGPGPRATRHWALARARGLQTVAKVQVNCTWELSAMPYLPVMNLVGEHLENLTRVDINGLMLSWSLGGYPSPNLQLVREFSTRPAPSKEEALQRVAEQRFGAAAAPHALRAWTAFSRAFTEYPYHGTVVYAGPSQVGPANLLYADPTGYGATMVGFPYDDLNSWRAVYPAEVLAGQFEKIAFGWKSGLEAWREVVAAAATDEHKQNAAEDQIIAEAAYLHFKSVANQARFILARDALRSGSIAEAAREKHRAAMRKIVEDESALAERMFTLTRQDARIGYEASNHYYYYPLDFVEKVINCQHIITERLNNPTQ